MSKQKVNNKTYDKMAEKKGKRKVWTKSETYLFLDCYKARKDEFEHHRKRKDAYEHVLEDMIFQGFEDETITPLSLERKMRTLLDAYKSAKDNSSRTGASPCPGSYMEEMEDLFGNKAIISHTHALDVGLTNTQPLEEATNFEDTTHLVHTSMSPNEPSTSKCVQNAKRVRKTAKDRYYEAKIAMKRNREETYAKYLEQKLELKRENDDRLQNYIEKILNDKKTTQ